VAKNPRNEALKEAFQANRPKVTSVVKGLVRDPGEADDVIQDVFEEFITTYDLGTTIERVSAWLVTVARNKIFDQLRRRKTRAEHAKSVAQDSEPQSEDEWMGAYLRKEIAAALELLPEEQRNVFVLHELEGKSFKEISAATGIPMGTLLTRKKYAVDFLRTYLKEIYDEL
jgi:RNA polymerase sigma factor (sigma-70 family)